MFKNLPINSDDPMFIAAECFRDTLLEIGVKEDSAEQARRTFLSLKRNTMEETQNKIRRIASRMSMSRAAAQDKQPCIPDHEESKDTKEEKDSMIQKSSSHRAKVAE